MNSFFEDTVISRKQRLNVKKAGRGTLWYFLTSILLPITQEKLKEGPLQTFKKVVSPWTWF